MRKYYGKSIAQESGDAKVLSEWAFELSTTSKNYFPPTIENENLVLRAVLKYISKEVYAVPENMGNSIVNSSAL